MDIGYEFNVWSNGPTALWLLMTILRAIKLPHFKENCTNVYDIIKMWIIAVYVLTKARFPLPELTARVDG